VNIKEYISSGVLESYALGDLTVSECVEVEKNLLLYPELKEEFDRVQQAQEKLLMTLSLEPPPRLKANLFKTIGEQKISLLTFKSSPVGFWKLAAAASVTVALVAALFAVNYRYKWKAKESSYNDLLAQNQRIAHDYNTVNGRLDKIENDIQIFENPDFKKIIMAGTSNSPNSKASVYWNDKTQEVYLSVQNMKELSAENQYQLWAIIDGKPVDAGVFDAQPVGLKKMKNVGKGAITFAVTIEPRGGKISPTLETIQVAGHVIRG
jgi:anti-sigma-K factor RskA